MKNRSNGQIMPSLFAPKGAFLNISDLSGLSRQTVIGIYYRVCNNIFYFCRSINTLTYGGGCRHRCTYPPSFFSDSLFHFFR